MRTDVESVMKLECHFVFLVFPCAGPFIKNPHTSDMPSECITLTSIQDRSA